MTVLQAEFQVGARCHLESLLFDGLLRPATGAADDGIPVDADHESFEVGRRQAGGIPGADEGAHAGAGDAIDLYSLFLQHFQYADMGATLGAAACQNQADPRALPAWGGNRGLIHCARGFGQQRETGE